MKKLGKLGLSSNGFAKCILSLSVIAASFVPEIASANFRCEALADGYHLVSSLTGKAVEGYGFTNPEKCRSRLATAQSGFVCTKFNEGEYRAISAGTGAQIKADGFSSLEKCISRVDSANSGFICGRYQDGSFSIISFSQGDSVAGDRFSNVDKCIARLQTAKNGFVCTRDSSVNYQIVVGGTGQWAGNGQRYSTIEACNSAL